MAEWWKGSPVKEATFRNLESMKELDVVGKNSSSLQEALGSFLVVQWLGVCAFTAEGMGLIPSRRTKILQALQHGQ